MLKTQIYIPGFVWQNRISLLVDMLRIAIAVLYYNYNSLSCSTPALMISYATIHYEFVVKIYFPYTLLNSYQPVSTLVPRPPHSSTPYVYFLL